jgi:hypothetical protein
MRALFNAIKLAVMSQQAEDVMPALPQVKPLQKRLPSEDVDSGAALADAPVCRLC